MTEKESERYIQSGFFPPWRERVRSSSQRETPHTHAHSHIHTHMHKQDHTATAAAAAAARVAESASGLLSYLSGSPPHSHTHAQDT